MKKDRHWVKLDNAGKIYPAARTRKWRALFRLSMTLDEEVDPAVLQQAVADLKHCFPTFYMHLKRGLFWYYLEEYESVPKVREDGPCPCLPFTKADGGFCFRVLYYRNRIAVEFFHVLTDGTGGMKFLKTLVARYLTLKHGILIPCTCGIADCTKSPDPEWNEDGFLRYAGKVAYSRRERNAYHIQGKPEPDGFIHLTCGILSVSKIKEKAKEKKVSVTTYLTAVMLLALDELQSAEGVRRRRRKPLKVSVPVNLRRFFPIDTMRNFSSYINPEIDPRMGDYTFDEVLSAVHHFMGLKITRKELSAKFTTNVRSEQNIAIRAIPLFLKDPVLKMVYNMVGDRKTSTTISNLGPVDLPDEMKTYITRVELILGPLKSNPVACGVSTFGDELYFNIVRTIKEPKLERGFFRRLVRLGIPVKIETNQRG